MRRFRLAAVAGALALTAGLSAAADYGTVKGTVKLTTQSEPAAINVTTDREHCLSKGPLKDETVITDKATGGLRYVIIYLRPDSTERSATFPKDQIHPDLRSPKPGTFAIDQPCCQFVPRVFAVREQTSLEVKNSSPVAHNVNFKSDQESFNETLPPGKHRATKPLKADPTLITFECNIHPWMKGIGMVFDHPYFAVTDEKGNFTLNNVPAGKWRVVYRHEKGYHKGREGRLGFPIEVKVGENKLPALSFEFPK